MSQTSETWNPVTSKVPVENGRKMILPPERERVRHGDQKSIGPRGASMGSPELVVYLSWRPGKHGTGTCGPTFDGTGVAKILLVEDDSRYAEVIKSCLEMEKHVVELIADGREALDFLREFSYDLVILDWQLPGLTGIDFCKEVRLRGASTPILMLTGRVSKDDLQEGLNAGADDYLAKPAHFGELTARVKALLRRAPVVVAEKITIRNVTILLDSKTVLVDDQPVELLPREYALLEFLMKNPNRVYSADELVDAVWPSTVTAAADAVRGAVKRLRQKLDRENMPSLIRNIYSVGYIIETK